MIFKLNGLETSKPIQYKSRGSSCHKNLGLDQENKHQ